MEMPRIFNAIYWKQKANSFENKYKLELEKNAPLQEELEQAKSELLSLYRKKTMSDCAVKDLKKRVCELEATVFSKKDKVGKNGKVEIQTTKSRRN